MKKLVIALATITIMITSAQSAPITTIKNNKCYDEKVVWSNLVKNKANHPKIAEAKALAEKGIASQKPEECETFIQQAIDLLNQ